MQQGNKYAFEQIYDQYAPMLFGILMRITSGKRKPAEQLLQQSFIYIWQHKSFYNPEKECIFAWMIRSARQISGTAIGAETAIPENSTTFRYEENPDILFPVHNNSPQPVNTNSETVIEHDPEFQEKALELTYILGKSIPEAARLLNVTPVMIKTGLRNAVNRLKATTA